MSYLGTFLGFDELMRLIPRVLSIPERWAQVTEGLFSGFDASTDILQLIDSVPYEDAMNWLLNCESHSNCEAEYEVPTAACVHAHAFVNANIRNLFWEDVRNTNEAPVSSLADCSNSAEALDVEAGQAALENTQAFYAQLFQPPKV